MIATITARALMSTVIMANIVGAATSPVLASARPEHVPMVPASVMRQMVSTSWLLLVTVLVV